jgi:hypothetical protein
LRYDTGVDTHGERESVNSQERKESIFDDSLALESTASMASSKVDMRREEEGTMDSTRTMRRYTLRERERRY